MKGNQIAIRLESDGTTTEIAMSKTGESGTNKAKDFTWLPNAGFTGLRDGANPYVIGFDRKNIKVVYGYITHTNQKTHKIIKDNLNNSPMFDGTIKSKGPRYCPSVEDKISRFSFKDSHQIFLEPETLDGTTIYPNGISTSLP